MANKGNVIVGTAGHVDHGKTCLIRALTGVDTDRLKEEKKRGITIELGFAEMENPQGPPIGIIDVPGHERFIKNMLAGIGGIDLVLLVIAADEGVMPQTREHFEILKMLGITKGILVLTKIDLVEEEWISLVREDAESLVSVSFLEGAPRIEVSAVTGEGMQELAQAIWKMAHFCGARRTEPRLLRIPVDRIFTVDGFGTVITGTLLEGTIHMGDEVTLYPEGKRARVRNLQNHGSMCQEAFAGQRIAVNLSGLKKDEVKRGCVIAWPESLEPTRMLDVRLKMFTDAGRSIQNGSRLHFYCGAGEVLCKAVLLEQEELSQGQEAFAQLRLEEEVAVRRGDRFILRFYSPLETIGGGVILDACPEKRRRFRLDLRTAFQAKGSGILHQALEAFLKEMSRDFPGLHSLSVRLGCTEEETSLAMEKLRKEGCAMELLPGRYLHRSHLDFCRERAVRLLDNFHRGNPFSLGIRREELRAKLSEALRFDEPRPVDALIGKLWEEGILEEIENPLQLLRLSGFQEEWKPEQRALKERLEQVYLDAGYQVPPVEEVVGKERNQEVARQLLDRLVQEGRLRRLSQSFYIHETNWKQAMALLKSHAKSHGSITLAQYRDLLSASRKYAALILEYLDEQKATRLEGEIRILLREV